MTDAAEYMRAAGIAKVFGLTERTVRRRFADGTIPSVKIGGARLASKAVLARLMGRGDPIPEVDETEK
jgi:hypothetical protein